MIPKLISGVLRSNFFGGAQFWHIPGDHKLCSRPLKLRTGTNDTEADQLGASGGQIAWEVPVRARLALLVCSSAKEQATSYTIQGAGSTRHALIPAHGMSHPLLKLASDDQEHRVPRLWLQPTASLHLG
ncbi:unnamed protein product [Polarella glacialis]|uniref:Uncharacterized protein n=1 Tax=Polarella glacialis TaxID=89957 RepID=A0A813LLV3_POLGL|nr:unnamed protein product [Polarella glacialis]